MSSKESLGANTLSSGARSGGRVSQLRERDLLVLTRKDIPANGASEQTCSYEPGMRWLEGSKGDGDERRERISLRALEESFHRSGGSMN